MSRRDSWIDVTAPMAAGMTVWPGDPPFLSEPLLRIAGGGGCNVTGLRLTTHTGTHVDAPWHFEDGGKRVHEVDPQVFFGEALVLALPRVSMITADVLPDNPLPPRVLFKTRNSDLPLDGPFHEDYVALDESAAWRLVADGVRLVGMDYLSVAPYGQTGQETHHVLLQHGVLIVEGLRLRGIEPGICEFVALPLALLDADGSPCRAFIRQ